MVVVFYVESTHLQSEGSDLFAANFCWNVLMQLLASTLNELVQGVPTELCGASRPP